MILNHILSYKCCICMVGNLHVCGISLQNAVIDDEHSLLSSTRKIPLTSKFGTECTEIFEKTYQISLPLFLCWWINVHWARKLVLQIGLHRQNNKWKIWISKHFLNYLLISFCHVLFQKFGVYVLCKKVIYWY